MSRRRFHAPPEAFASDHRSVMLEADEARHLREVLRLKPGDEVFVFDGVGKEFKCSIENARRNTAHLNILAEVSPAHPESPLQLTLAVALLKSDKFDLVVQKTTELGVVCVVPVITKLADVRLRDVSDAEKRLARWRRIALEAAKQSGRALVPEIAAPVSFDELIKEVSANRGNVMFAERGGQALESLKQNFAAHPLLITSLVGSEGGWTDGEIEEAKGAGWIVVTLGGRTLRAETAAITATTLLQHLFGDLK
ncbi:MAG: 16S rRNA (uracil(1498)-N(3))-methyltransferase [Pyrinomonadaceae bacterium]